MKILKKLLVICFFSLFFIVNTNAAINIQYNGTAISFIQQDKDNIIPLIKNNISLFNLDNVDDYIFSVYKTASYRYNLYVFNGNINITNSSGQFTWSGKSCEFTTDSSYSSITVSNCPNQFYTGNTAYIESFFKQNYFIPEFGSNSNLRIYNANYYDYTFVNYLNNDSNITLLKRGNLLLNDVIYALNDYSPIIVPTYTLNQEVLEDGSVKLTFNFTNYDSNNNYAFTITNKVNGEEYGISNPYVSIFPNIIPFGSSYEIILQYDTVITVSLSQYIPIDGTNLYYREPLYVDSYDINNIVFSNPQNPYFSIIFQNKNNLIGKFNNINNNNSCYYKLNTDNVETNVDCNDTLDLQLLTNGYIDIIIKKQNNVIYDRKINILGGSETEPYIIYNIEKQDFYSKINWYVENYNNQLKYRYSINNGLNYSSWENLTNNNQFINVYQNSTVIIEIANNTNDVVYDSKAINVIVSIENLQNFNNTTNNLIDKFNNIFNVNSNILVNIESFWSTLKTTKLYLFVFIPFITSIICAIIYLIRRK